MTEEDAETIKSYSSDSVEVNQPIDPSDLSSDVPAHLIDLKPQIRIDGEVKATGDAVTMGTRQNFQINFSYLDQIGLGSDTINNEVIARANYVITLNTGKIDSKQLKKKSITLKEKKQNLEKENFNKFKSETVADDILHTIGLFYFSELDTYNRLLAQKQKIKSTRITSALITATNLDVSYMFGQPRTASPGGLSIDVDRDLSTVKSINGDEKKERNYNQLSGVVSSYLEGDIFE